MKHSIARRQFLFTTTSLVVATIAMQGVRAAAMEPVPTLQAQRLAWAGDSSLGKITFLLIRSWMPMLGQRLEGRDYSGR